MEHFNMFSCFSRSNMPGAPVDDRHVRIQGLSKEDELTHYGWKIKISDGPCSKENGQTYLVLGNLKKSRAMDQTGFVWWHFIWFSTPSRLQCFGTLKVGLTDPKFLWLSAEFTMTDS